MVLSKRQFNIYFSRFLSVILAVLIFSCNHVKRGKNVKKGISGSASGLELIKLSEDGTHFIRAESGKRFVVWGVNYDHDRHDRLIEDYWDDEWPDIAEDFEEIKSLGANAVRIHLQVSKFMITQKKPNDAALEKLKSLVELAEETGLYLDITGLGCYHKNDVPVWYDALDEPGRWSVQALFWEAVAKTCAGSNAVFCYDLMNEPVLPGENEKETDWLADEFSGKYFVQRISLDLAGRSRKQAAKKWINKLVTAVRKHDYRHMISVGVIPWAHIFPGAEPLFYSKEAGKNLDFVSVHFYPQKGEVNKALKALAVYDTGKPVVIEETSPLWCGEEEFDTFINASREIASGYFGFYWGKTIDEYAKENSDIASSIMKNFLEYFRMKAPAILRETSLK